MKQPRTEAAMLRRGVWLFLLPAAVACSSRGDGPYGDLEPARRAVDGTEGRRCHYVATPVAPSSLDPLTRPGTRGSIVLWAAGEAATDSVDVSIRYGRDGRLAWVRSIRGNISPERRAELERILGNGLLEEGPSDWGVRVRVVGGQVDAVLPAVRCLPERAQSPGRVPALFGTAREMHEAMQARGRPIGLEVGLDETGRVVDVRLVQSSGSRLIDQHAVDYVRGFGYRPALHDGIGVPSVLPVQLRVSRR